MAIKKIADLDEFLGLLASTEPDKLIKKGSCRVIRPIVEKMSKKHQNVVFVEATDKIDGFSGADEAKLSALTEKYLRAEI
ncbi:hypothetical protein BGZ70_008907 [Mortierella alpina]|uniref:Uncharacterized protein n=1 Tax=Mortierella alpina TaxID=64518 RepID=A0A9P6M6G0_MORAP|nr:hypothetical protein BGZ70_008907 [Mortierella alpina]